MYSFFSSTDSNTSKSGDEHPGNTSDIVDDCDKLPCTSNTLDNQLPSGRAQVDEGFGDEGIVY